VGTYCNQNPSAIARGGYVESGPFAVSTREIRRRNREGKAPAEPNTARNLHWDSLGGSRALPVNLTHSAYAK
jgi:hypothetical protein